MRERIDADVCCGCEPLHYCVEPEDYVDGSRWHCTVCHCEWIPGTYAEAKQ